jgi:hypothetical protein
MVKVQMRTAAWRTTMPRHNFREIVLMVLAASGSLGILLLVGSRLIHAAATSIPPANTGGIGGFAGGFSISLFAMLIGAIAVVMVVVVVAMAVLLWKR